MKTQGKLRTANSYKIKTFDLRSPVLSRNIGHYIRDLAMQLLLCSLRLRRNLTLQVALHYVCDAG